MFQRLLVCEGTRTLEGGRSLRDLCLVDFVYRCCFVGVSCVCVMGLWVGMGV